MEVFHKNDVLNNFAKFAEKTTVPEALSYKVGGFSRLWDSGTGIFLWILWNLGHLWATATIMNQDRT